VEDGPRKLVKQVVAATALLWAGAVHAQPENATGAIVVNGRSFALRYAYTSVQPGSFDKNTLDVKVLLTDVPVSEPQRDDVFALSRLARTGKLHGLEVVIDAKGEPLSGFLFLDAFDGMVSVSGMHRFERKALDRSLIAGRVFTEGPRTFSGITWAYDATFSSTIVRPPTAEETAASLKTAPALAATAHLEAVQRDFDAFATTLTASSAASYRASGGAERFKAIRAETPPDSRVVALVNGQDDTRIATVHSVRRDGVIVESFLKLRLEGGVWKIER
jgi:hypothetical protein